MPAEQRITLAERNPNRLFVSWLEQWLQYAETKDSMKRHALAKALAALRRYPLRMQSGRDCCILEGFGPSICQMLDKQLAVHLAATSARQPIVRPTANAGDSEHLDRSVQEVLHKVRVQVATEKKKRKRLEAKSTVAHQPTVVDLFRKYGADPPATAAEPVEAGEITEAALDSGTVRRGTYEIILLVDTMETAGKSKRSLDLTIQELERHNTRHEVRRLSVGDFLWIARCKASTSREFVLPHIVERKRMDDLAGSIKDGRFHEQKFRLADCGIANVVYLVESRGTNAHLGLPLQTLHQAATNTQVQSGFAVRYTDSHPDSMRYLAMMTELLLEMYRNSDLIVANTTIPTSDDIHISNRHDRIPVLDFAAFTSSTTKLRNFRVRDMFVRQLLQLKTLTLEKATAITEKYPTPSHLLSAFDECRDADTAESLLAPIEYGMMRKTIGLTISRCLYQFYNARQPT